jgi:hypothetical protein
MTTKTPDSEFDDIALNTEQTDEQLNDKQHTVYQDHREKLARWALTIGKEPRKAEGYAHETVKRRMYRLDKFYRYIWNENDGVTLEVSPADADAWTRYLAKQGDVSQSYKACCQKSVKMLFKWRRDEYAEPVEWDPDITFSSSGSGTRKRDYFALDTLRELMDASLEFDSLPSYTGVTPEERSEINVYLAQRLGEAEV